MITIKQSFKIGDVVKIKSLSNKYSEGVPDSFLNNICVIEKVSGLYIYVNNLTKTIIIDKDDLEKASETESITFKSKYQEVQTEVTRSLSEIETIFKEVFGEDNVDRHHDRYFMIRIPEMNIIDGINKHIYKEFYVDFEFQYDEKGKYWKFYNALGIRGELNFIEYTTHYGYSHCNTSPGNWGNFCYGNSSESEIKKIITSLQLDGYNYEKFVIFAYTFKNYLGWESQEGGPYYSIRNLKMSDKYKFSLSHYTNTDISKIYTAFIKSKVKPDLRFENGKIKLIINDKLKDLLNTVCPANLKVPYNTNLKNYVNRLDIGRINSEIKTFNSNNSREDITFKGRTFKPTIVDTITSEVSNDVYIPEYLINSVSQRIELNYSTFLENKFKKKYEHYITKVY